MQTATKVKVAALALGIAGLLALDLIREPRTRTNPEIFPFFRAIEEECRHEAWPSERCRSVIELKRSCDRASSGCTALEYYCWLEQLGFDLPPFWLAGERAASSEPCRARTG